MFAALALSLVLQDPTPVTPAAVDSAAAVVQDCSGKCPTGVSAPRFASFPNLEPTDPARAGVDLSARRSRTFLLFGGIVGVDGILEPETIEMTGGTARGMESEMRRGLAQARFEPARRGDLAVRARVTIRFEFEAEGTSWVKYSYRVTAR